MAVKTARTVSEDDAPPKPKPTNEDPKTHTVVDSLGRTIVFKNVNIIDELKVAKAAGPHATNQQVLSIYYLAQSVRTIDGHPGPMIINERTADARVQWIGTEGYRAVNDKIVENLRADLGPDAEDDDDGAIRNEVDPDVLKNS